METIESPSVPSEDVPIKAKVLYRVTEAEKTDDNTLQVKAVGKNAFGKDSLIEFNHPDYGDEQLVKVGDRLSVDITVLDRENHALLFV